MDLQENIESLVEFPLFIDNDCDYISTVERRVSNYIDFLNNLKNLKHLKKYSSLIDMTIRKTIEVISGIKDAFKKQFIGRQNESVEILKSIIDKDESLFKTNIFDSYAFSNVYYYERKPIQSLYLFKGRVNRYESFKDYCAEEMFHIPLSKRELITTQRYSLPGIPCIYLAQNSYIVWKELGMPNFDNLSVSAFNFLDGTKNIIDLTYPFKKVFDIIIDSNKFYKEYVEKNERDIEFLFNNLSLYPIRVAVSIKCNKRDRAFKSEYVIPQLLMNCLNDKIIGIAYSSNEISSQSDLPAVNLAIPILQFKPNEDFGFPKTFLETTDSINFGYYNRLLKDSDNIRNAKGINNSKAFCYARPISTFNQMVEWKDMSYDKFTEYEDSIYYTFDDFILYMKKFKKIY